MKFDSKKFISKLVSFESVSADSACAGKVRGCAEFLKDSFEKFGFEAELVKTKLHPIVFARRNCSSGKPLVRVLCYGHYDVQPPDPIGEWKTDPFKAVVKNGKIWGRGTADNKGPFTCIIAGFMNFISKNPSADIDIAFMLEGEEEISSPSMDGFLKKYSKVLSGYDFIVLSDTSSASLDQVVITTGIRGVGAFEAVFRGAKSDSHSGIFGGAVYNPLRAMSEVCASLHDKDGFVSVPHFYDGVLSPSKWERKQIKKCPFDSKGMASVLGLKRLMKQRGWTPEEAVRLLPTLEFTGMGGGYQGEGNKSIIPAECFVKISCRSVPRQEMGKMLSRVKRAIIDRCPKEVEVSFLDSGDAGDPYFVSPSEGGKILRKAFSTMDRAAAEAFGKPPLYLREGGSIPLIAKMKKLTGLDCIMTGLFTPADNLHAPNEGFFIEMMEKASLCYEKFFAEMSKRDGSPGKEKRRGK